VDNWRFISWLLFRYFLSFLFLFFFFFHLPPFLQEDRYHFVEEMFTHHNDDAVP
jgi:hypothetical protein